MGDVEIIEVVRDSLNEVLRWVGFGTLVGLMAKAIMPGRDPGGAVATMLMGIGGSVIGCGGVMFFANDARLDPISGYGFVAATGGAFILLFFYRMLAGSFFSESDVHTDRIMHRSRKRSRRRRLSEEAYHDAA